MLKHIPEILPPRLVAAMMEMAEGDELLIADVSFPAHRVRGENAVLVRMDGRTGEETLSAVMELLPLQKTGRPVTLCLKGEGEPPLADTCRKILRAAGEMPEQDLDGLESYSFEQRARQAYVIVVTAERDGSLLLTKGRIE